MRFLLELAMLAALGFWGWHATASPLRLALALGAPALAAAIWGLWVAPKAKWPLRYPAKLAVEVALFGLAAAALATCGHERLAIALALTYALDRGILALG